jgi:hypothetical protein
MLYTNAECVISSKVVKIDKDKLDQAFQKYPSKGMIFYRKPVAPRLIENYNAVLSQGSQKEIT